MPRAGRGREGGVFMTITAKVLLGFFVVAFLAHLWLFRLDVHSSGSATGSVLVLDRWSGRVSYCISGGHCYPMYPQAAQDKE
jgi:hypothetical protein